MFSCCFRREPSPPSTPASSLRQTLLENSRISSESLNFGHSAQHPRNQEVKTASLLLANPQLQRMQLLSSASDYRQPSAQNTNHKTSPNMAVMSSTSLSQVQVGQKPQEVAEQKEESNQSVKTSSSSKQSKWKRSQLWEVESGTKIIYLSQKKQEQMVFVFKINHVKTSELNPISYTLNLHAHSSSNNYRTKAHQIHLDFVFWNKSVSDLHSILRPSQKSSNIRPIFGVSKADGNALKTQKAYYDLFDPQELITIGSQCLRLQVFDRIVICCLNEQSFEQILTFSSRKSDCLERDDMEKTIFLFPSHLNLAQIQSILAKVLSRFVVSEKLQSILKFIGYQIDLVQSPQMDYFIVRSNFSQVEEGDIAKKEFQIKLQLILGILMMEINERNFRAYEEMVKSFLSDLTISKYFKLINFLHSNPASSVKRIGELKIFDYSLLCEIEKSDRIKMEVISSEERMIVLRKKMKRRIGELLADYKSTQTPVEDSESLKKEWDDQLHQSDLKAEKISKYFREEERENDYNIFEAIGDGEIEDSNLDILSELQLREIDEE